MNFGGHFLWILCILLIHFNFVILTDPLSKDGAGTSGHVNHPADARLHPLLEWMFALFGWLAKNWPNLENQPNILEGTPIIEKMKEKSVKEVTQFTIHFRDYMKDKEEKEEKIQEKNTDDDDNEEKGTADVEKEKEKEEKEWWARHNLVHGKYANTKEMAILSILENIFNKVHNTEEEITEGLHRDRERHQGEDENERRERYKNEFRYAFLVDCIYAAHMNDGNDGDIDFEAITEKLQLRHWRVKDHPLFGILMANKCGEEEVVHAFLSVLQNEIFQPNLTLNSDLIEKIFEDNDYVLLVGFLNAMKGKITKKEREAKEKEKAKKATGKKPLLPLPMPMPYFPERLPKLHTLRSLLATLIDITGSIIKTIKSKYKPTVRKNNKIFTRAFGGLTDRAAFMYFVIRNGTHYAEALKELPAQIKGKMHKITYENSSFWHRIDQKMYGKLSEKVDYLHLIKYLAINSFGFTKEQLPQNEPNEYRLYDNNKAFRGYQENLVARISEKIVNEYHESHSLGGKSVPELDEKLFQQIQLNVSRIAVVLQDEEANRHNHKN